MDYIKGIKSGIDNVTSSKIYKLRENDVLIGRGSPSVYHRGNVLFRTLIEYRLMDFIAAGYDHEMKNEIAQSVISEIHAKDGRFLRRTKDRALILVHDKSFLLEKAKQVFRDLAKRAQIRLSDRKIRVKNKVTDTPKHKEACVTIKDSVSDQSSVQNILKKDPNLRIAQLESDRITPLAAAVPKLLVTPAIKNVASPLNSVNPLFSSTNTSQQHITTGFGGCGDMPGTNEQRQFNGSANYQAEARLATKSVSSLVSRKDIPPLNRGKFVGFIGTNQPSNFNFNETSQIDMRPTAKNVASLISSVDTLFDSSIVSGKRDLLPTSSSRFTACNGVNEHIIYLNVNGKNRREATQLVHATDFLLNSSFQPAMLMNQYSPTLQVRGEELNQQQTSNTNNIDYRNYSAQLLQMQIDRRRKST